MLNATEWPTGASWEFAVDQCGRTFFFCTSILRVFSGVVTVLTTTSGGRLIVCYISVSGSECFSVHECLRLIACRHSPGVNSTGDSLCIVHRGQQSSEKYKQIHLST